MTSCSKEELSLSDTKITYSGTTNVTNIPFTDIESLNRFNDDSTIVNWKLARKLSMIDLEDEFKSELGWEGTKFSDKPVVIYGYDSRPKYYEFIILDETNKPIGTVTSFARKETDGATSHVLPGVRNYNNVTSKGSAYKIFTGNYPTNVLIGIPGKSGNEPSVLVDPETGESAGPTEEKDVEDLISFLSSLTIEQLEEYNIEDVNALIESLQTENEENQTYAHYYWQLMDEIQPMLDTISDEDIIILCNEDKGWTTQDIHIASRYNNTALRNTRWSGWCGPTAIAWIYRGLYSSYDGTYLPIAGDAGFRTSNRWRNYHGGRLSHKGFYDYNDGGDDDNDKKRNDLDKDWVEPISNSIDNGLYHDIADKCNLYNWPRKENGPVMPWRLNNAIKEVTDKNYTCRNAVFAEGHRWIRKKNLPVIVLTGVSHYIVAFGSKYEYYNWDIKWTIRVGRWFRKTITIGPFRNRTGRWLLIQDNGSTTSDHNYDQYWKKTKVDFDVEYKIVKK